MLTRGLFPGHTPETLRDHRYFTVDSVPDLERKWPKVMALEPDIIKLFLVHSESYAARKDDPEFYGLRGLDPALVPEIAAKARAAGRRVAAHVETPADFRSAIGAGVDEIVHVPRSGVLTQEDAELAARHGTILITTLAVVSARPTPEQSASELQIRLRNLELLLNAGANVVIGSDAVADTSRAETEFLLESGVVDELALLRLWTGATPRAIFPDRRIGALAEGYEASFVALGGNPLEDWRNVRDVDVLFKQGRVIELPDAAP
jgi:imidazolonepropionase-like amidohydrolase